MSTSSSPAFPVEGTFVGYLLADPLMVCLFRSTDERGVFTQQPVTWEATTPKDGIYVARLLSDLEQTVYFCHSRTVHGRFYQQRIAPDMIMCSCPWGLNNMRPQDKVCKHVTCLRHVVTEHMGPLTALGDAPGPAPEAPDPTPHRLTISMPNLTIDLHFR